MSHTRTTPLRVGIMSFAHVHATSYARLLADWPGVELLGTDPDGADDRGASSAPAHRELRGRALATELGINYVDSYRELLDWKPDAVIVTSANSRHRELVEQAALTGAHVLCEKPLATTREDALAMTAACRNAGVILMTAYPVRFSPAFEQLKTYAADNRLGELLAMTGTNNGRIPVGDRAWFTDPELSGGGALVDHVVHVADLIDALTGLRAVSVHAAANRILHSDKPEVRAETGGLVTITYENGLIATIDCSWSQPDYAPTWGGLTLQVVGSEGIATINPFAQHVGGFSEAQRSSLFLPYGMDTDRLMIEAFLSGVRTGTQPQPDAAVGVRTLDIVLAAQRSAATGEVVQVAQD
ncbi:Gfo/Idh/MocA family oxidoreductase [Lysinibacter sp. HNR]|uniref:Gfo/Idh/MocA family protein n=1 Tax=Lysinibacter sp. HNR TaxID=3031408 RepID=UPI002435E488|nr:Gfo/Idh/MocA family oxidoreductase [Lysinibacter sp. HNR]WGD37815.1 Gfo/Idh/MocA family oxidoreductase [Lysinibacter sp. HNR]